MATGTVMPVPRIQFLDADGDPLSGGKLYTYAAGTTNNLATYTTSDLSGSANANPVVLDAGGRATVFLQPKAYKFKLDNSSDVEQWVQDNVYWVPIGADTVEITGTAGEALAKPIWSISRMVGGARPAANGIRPMPIPTSAVRGFRLALLRPLFLRMPLGRFGLQARWTGFPL